MAYVALFWRMVVCIAWLCVLTYGVMQCVWLRVNVWYVDVYGDADALCVDVL